MAWAPEDLTMCYAPHIQYTSKQYIDLFEGDEDTEVADSEPSTNLRSHAARIRRRRRQHSYRPYETDEEEDDFEHIPMPENVVEAHRIVNNYRFGFKKWKSHLTERPLESRSEIVKELYSEPVSPADVPTCRPGNIMYAVLFGWWLFLIYCIIGSLMYITIIGRHYGPFCFKLGCYFLWPFGKFVHRENPKAKVVVSNGSLSSVIDCEELESEPLFGEESRQAQHPLLMEPPETNKYFSWKDPGTYVWLLLGLPILIICHLLTFIATWLMIIMIPISKINFKTIKIVLLMPPKRLRIDKSSMDVSLPASDVLLYTHQAVNVYYYKYSVDGVNVIAANLLIFVVFALVVGYIDTPFITSKAKFFLSMLAIIPLAYYIGLGITSLSAQCSYAVGAVLNATFGSIVEITLYILSLRKGILLSNNNNTNCYVELVKSALVGTLLATMMFIPGICMVIGGLKHNTQIFNPKSAGLSSTLLFVSVACTFAPTIYSKAFGIMHCSDCKNVTQFDNSTGNGTKWTLECANCIDSIFGAGGDATMYDKHIRPLVYTCAILMPLAYIIGMIFSLKTHRADIYENFQDAQNANGSGSQNHGHGGAHWGRIKSSIILLIATVLVCLCADIMTENIQDLMLDSGLTVYFIGVTLVALVPDIPEFVNGIQFAMHNNISLSIELGSCIAVQVCMLQIPLLVLADLIYPMNFYLVFEDIHLWSVVFSVLMMNYVFQDGKSNYFQGSALCFVYCALIALYYFAPDVKCDLGG